VKRANRIDGNSRFRQAGSLGSFGFDEVNLCPQTAVVGTEIPNKRKGLRCYVASTPAETLYVWQSADDPACTFLGHSCECQTSSTRQRQMGYWEVDGRCEDVLQKRSRDACLALYLDSHSARVTFWSNCGLKFTRVRGR